ncbi:MAG: DNA-binding protein [Anaerolineaceae bacterium]|nr:DNA-binding protein [Anaerolineaceae bacterium]
MIVYALRLRPGQDILEELISFSNVHRLQAVIVLTCVGSLKQASLRLANQPDGTLFTGFFEIVSLTGTVSPDGAHLHISISDSNGKTVGGHLMTGSLIYTTAEIVLGELEGLRFARPMDAETGYDELVVTER